MITENPIFLGKNDKKSETGIDKGHAHCYNYSQMCNKFVIIYTEMHK